MPLVEDQDPVAPEPACYLVDPATARFRTGDQRAVRAEDDPVAEWDPAVGREIVYQPYRRHEPESRELVRHSFDQVRLHREPDSSASPLEPVIQDHTGQCRRFPRPGSVADADACSGAVGESLLVRLARVDDPFELHRGEPSAIGQFLRQMRAVANRRGLDIREAGRLHDDSRVQRAANDVMRGICERLSRRVRRILIGGGHLGRRGKKRRICAHRHFVVSG